MFLSDIPFVVGPTTRASKLCLVNRRAKANFLLYYVTCGCDGTGHCVSVVWNVCPISGHFW